MQTTSQRILKNTMILYVRQIFIIIIGLITTRLSLKVLGVVDFGLFAAILSLTTIMHALFGSLAMGVQRYMLIEVEKNDLIQLNKVYNSSVNICLLFSAIILFIGGTLGIWLISSHLTIPSGRLADAQIAYIICLVNCVFGILNISNNSLIIANENIGLMAYVNSLDAFLKFLSVIILFYIKWDKLIMYAILLLISQIILRFIYIFICRKCFDKIRYRFIVDKTLMRELLKFSSCVGISRFSLSGLMQGTNILLNIFFGPIMNSAYAVASQAHNGIKSFCYNFLFASNLPIIKYYASGEIKKMNKLLFSVCKMAFFMVFLLSLPFVFNVNFILKIWLGNVPQHANSFLILLIIYACLDVFMYPLDSAAQSTGKIMKYSIMISIMTILALPLAAIAYWMGTVAEVVFVIAILLSFISMVVRISILSGMLGFDQSDFYLNVFFKIFIVSISTLLFPLVYYYISEVNVLTIIIGFVLSYVTSFFIIYKFGLNIEERLLAKNLVLSLVHRLYYGKNL